MPYRVDTRVQTMEAPRPNSPFHRPPTHPKPFELPPRHHSILATRQLGDQRIDMSLLRTT